ncbi:MAG: hypothetical protein ABIF77_13440, partial [bacterium]
MKTNRGLIGVVMLLAAAACFPASLTAQLSFTEDFSTLDYCDPGQTTAWWDTDNSMLRLPGYTSTSIGQLSWADPAQGIAIDGDLAFISSQTWFYILDISNPALPTMLGDCNTYNNTISHNWGVTVSGNYAFVCTEDEVEIIDISDPTAPVNMGSFDPDGMVFEIIVDGDLAYTASTSPPASGYLTVWDITNPLSPSKRGQVSMGNSAYGLDVQGNLACVAVWSGMKTVNVSDPDNPVVRDTSAGMYNYNVYDVAMAGDLAYVACGDEGMRVVDISDPDVISVVGSYDPPNTTPRHALKVALSGDYAYLAFQETGLHVVDITDPTSPEQVGTYDTPGEALDVAVAGQHAFVADGNNGLRVVQIADVVSSTMLNTIAFSDRVLDIAQAGDVVYLAVDEVGLVSMDISDPANPSLLDTYNTSQNAEGIALAGDVLYLADRIGGLKSFDISDPNNLLWLDTIDNSTGACSGLAVAGDHLFLCRGYYNLRTYDISDPANIVDSTITNVGSDARKIALAGNHAFVAGGANGFIVVNIEDPYAPVVVDTVPTGDFTRYVAVAGDIAYCADGSNGLVVYDITNPASPSQVGSDTTPSNARHVAISGDRAFVASLADGVFVYDISTPSNPILLETLLTSPAHWTTIIGDYAYVGTNSGLEIYWIAQGRFEVSSNIGVSLSVESSPFPISTVRLMTIETGSTMWELSSDDGVTWTEVVADGSWSDLTNPGTSLLWRASLDYTGGGSYPYCSELTIEWEDASPHITDISDIPNDQGRQISLVWDAVEYDVLGSPIPINAYAIYRRIDTGLQSAPGFTPDPALDRLASGSQALATGGDVGPGELPVNYPPGDWHFLTTVPACCEQSYATVVPTLADSTVNDGIYYSVFFVRALSATPGLHFDAAPDSGYSVDNLAPAAPGTFNVAYSG